MIPSVSSMGYTPAAASLNPDQIAEAFSEQKTFQEKSNFVQGLRASYNIGYLACSWIENGANPLSLASLLPHLTLNEMQVLKTFRDIQKDIQICIKNIFDCDPSKNKFFTECCGIFDLLSENDLENWISSLDLPLPVMGFLIAALPAAKKSRYLRILAEKFHYEMTYYYASSRTAMLWRSGEADRHYLAKVTLQNCPSRSRLEFLHNTSLKNPTLFTYFLVELNPIEMSYLQEILSDTLICRGLQYVSSSYTFCKQVIEKLNRNGGATLLVNVVNFNFQSSIAGSVRTSLAALPSHIGFADLELDEQGFDNFALNFETGIQKIPPLLIALGALDDNLTDWLIKASRLFTESQLSMFFWTLPYPKIKQHLPFILTNLSGSYLETVLKAIPSDLRNQALDTKVQEISLPLLAAKNALKDFYFDSSDDESTVCGMLNLVCHWKEKLSELLYHPKALPFWHVGSNYHNLMSYKSEIKNTLESYENKVKEIQARQLKTIDALPTFKESPPPFLTDSLRLSLGSPNLESAGLRDIRDLEVLGITLEMISEFETFEEDFVDNLSLLKIADWEQVKWSGDNQALAQFISANGRTPPEGISNPFILLKRYLGQPELDASWKTLNKNSIFTLSLIYDQCLIETSEELFNLKVLAGKLSS